MAKRDGLRAEIAPTGGEPENDQVLFTRGGGSVALLSAGKRFGYGRSHNGMCNSVGVGYDEARGLHLIGYSRKGNVMYRTPMIDGKIYCVGPHYAHLWVDPADEPDPIKRILREFDVSAGCLEQFEGDALGLYLRMDYGTGNRTEVSEHVFTDGCSRDDYLPVFWEFQEYYAEDLKEASVIVVGSMTTQGWSYLQEYYGGPEETVYYTIEQVLANKDARPETVRRILSEAVEQLEKWVIAHDDTIDQCPAI